MATKATRLMDDQLVREREASFRKKTMNHSSEGSRSSDEELEVEEVKAPEALVINVGAMYQYDEIPLSEAKPGSVGDRGSRMSLKNLLGKVPFINKKSPSHKALDFRDNSFTDGREGSSIITDVYQLTGILNGNDDEKKLKCRELCIKYHYQHYYYGHAYLL
jgi:hypothetical protein